MRDVIPDLWRTYFPPSAQAWSHHYSTDSRENTGTYCMWAVASCQGKCNMHQTKSNLSPVDWCVCVCMSSRLTLIVYLCVRCVQMQQRDRKRRVSVGSLGAGLAHRQTNTLHYRPIYLINWATLSAKQHSATHDCQQHPCSIKSSPPLPSPPTPTQTNPHKASLTDCLND